MPWGWGSQNISSAAGSEIPWKIRYVPFTVAETNQHDLLLEEAVAS